MSAPLRLQTSVWNPLGRRRALLLHGLTSDAGSWWRVAGELAEDGFMVVAPDLRSHGRSPTAVDHHVTAFADDVELLGDGWDLLVGHSLGGSVGAILAARQTIGATLLIDPVIELPDAEREALRAGIKANFVPGDADSVRMANPLWSERDVQRKVIALRAMTPDVVDAVFEYNDPWEVTWTIPDWSGRVHLLAADPSRDPRLTPATIAEATRIAGEQVTGSVVPGAGHSIQREQPEAVMAVIRELVGVSDAQK